jgi:hypothetical protein
VDGFDQVEKEIVEVFYFTAKGRCECCGKTVKFEDRGKRNSIMAWEAHLIPGWDAPLILCLGEPESCHLNCGHNGDYKNPAAFPEVHRMPEPGAEEEDEDSPD